MKTSRISVSEAVFRAKVTRQTILNWCHEYGIGIKVGGRWKVDPHELQKILDGAMYQELMEKANGTQNAH